MSAGLTERLAAAIHDADDSIDMRYATHIAAALAPLVAEEVAAAEVRALRRAAVRYDETEAGPGDHAASWLRNRADRIATTDGGVS